MTTKLDPAEVLAYLNELGYHNITAVQLKEFMKDLKRLIKYEKYQKELDIENVEPCPAYFQCNNYPVTSTRSAPTELSTAKQSIKKNIISVAIRKKSAPSCYNYQIPCDSSECTPVSNVARKIQIDNNENINLAPEVPKHSTESSLTTEIASPKRPKSCDTKYSKQKSRVTFQGNSLKPKASYIIPRAPVKPHKCDPVALYHKYQEGWKKHKLPGEDNHLQLRWAIRERLLGQPHTISAAPSMEQIATKRKTVNRI
ncbi:hypothetical protein ILUMI_05177 [Ignelater luminosus]|uniref:Centriolar and ciliogenesis-associated protein HYLS1 C-terminal domain-containing protein n=1 Tax=Ignelater luminosus TaxID=2038154 RepID=A0A8K0D7K8_IGNLU|nr:hypothetical protein ILUMI_05177 [Ignelater luminosus]